MLIYECAECGRWTTQTRCPKCNGMTIMAQGQAGSAVEELSAERAVQEAIDYAIREVEMGLAKI